MAMLNCHYQNLTSSYVFRQVNEKAAAFSDNHPQLPLYKMGVGNTTRPLAKTVSEALHSAVDRLGDETTYTGYGDELGEVSLRRALADYYQNQYGVSLSADEFVLSDGAKSDTANLASIFSHPIRVAVQDPVYPVYVESNILLGNKLIYLECNEANGFVPKPPAEKVDIIYLCSPNNPTGTVATREQLTELVAYARQNQAVIIFDAAYSAFVRDPNLPRSIYEVEGAKDCAIEVNSFSKWAGFTGMRLAWTIIPEELTVENTELGDMLRQWKRRQLVHFNGPSNIIQAGGLAVLSEAGLKECDETIDYYLENAQTITIALNEAGLKSYGGQNSPYIWLKTPDGMSSWQLFDELLQHTQVVTTPGAGFGDAGEGFIRISAFASKQTTSTAMRRIVDYMAQR